MLRDMLAGKTFLNSKYLRLERRPILYIKFSKTSLILMASPT